MEIVARIVSDALVSQTKSGKKVVNFPVAINDYYKPKNGEGVQTTTFIRCTYWIGPRSVSEAIAPRLIKGVLVELYGGRRSGRLGVEAYTNNSGDPVGVINFQVSRIKLHSSKSNFNTASGQTASVSVADAAGSADLDDDLPF